MNIKLSKNAQSYIKFRSITANQPLAITIFQYNKKSCSGSYTNLRLELESVFSLWNNDFFELFNEIDMKDGTILQIFVEKRLKSEFEGVSEIMIDIIEHQKFDDKFTELILK